MYGDKPEIVCFGEVLWDNLPHGCFPGGAPMNVAIHLFQLGLSSSIISRVGNDLLGEDIKEFIGKHGVSIAEIQDDKDHETGIVQADVTDPLNVKYDIKYPVAWDFIQFNENAAKTIRASKIMVFGSLSVRNNASENALLKYLESAPYAVFDVNLRPPHFSERRIKSLLSLANFVKMNEEELELIASWYGVSGEFERILERLSAVLNLEVICVTLGDKGAILYDSGEIYKHGGFVVEVVDTIGSGDSFLAALLSKRLIHADPQESLTFACAVGAFVASQAGATPSIDIEEINAMIR